MQYDFDDEYGWAGYPAVLDFIPPDLALCRISGLPDYSDEQDEYPDVEDKMSDLTEFSMKIKYF